MKTAWEKVQIARQTQRPKTTDYIKNIFNDFIEFHGDRNSIKSLNIFFI